MSNKSHIFGYLLGLLIFVIGIPALMWLVSVTYLARRSSGFLPTREELVHQCMETGIMA